jgi:hypothetical protein
MLTFYAQLPVVVQDRGCKRAKHSQPLALSGLQCRAQDMLGIAQRLGPRLLRALDQQVERGLAAAASAMEE